MGDGPAGTVIRHIRRLGVAQDTRDSSDAHLLQRFAADREEAAFAALVQRHGRLVWDVCRHVLRHEQDAEDAFQATFLVLAKKAGSVRKGEALASWLHGTAYRVALRAKRDAAIRRAHERRGQSMPAEKSLPETVLREALALLDEEVDRLPDRQRAAFVLCCLEGKSLAEAARQLGWKEGTVSGTLARARQLLRRRLTARGVTLSAVLAAVALGRQAGSAAVPAGLARATVRAALGSVLGKTGAASVASRAAALAEGVTRPMLLNKVRTTAVLLALSLAVTGTGLLAPRLLGERPAEAGQLGAPGAAPPHPDAPGREGGGLARADRFGDPLPPGAIARLGSVRFRHGGRIYSLAPSPDGKVLVSRGLDGSVRLWDPASGKELACLRLSAAGNWTDTVAFSPDGKRLAAATGQPGTKGSAVVFWEASAAREAHRIEVKDGTVSAVAFAPDGKTLAGVTGDTIRLWDPVTGRELRRLKGHRDDIEALTFAPDGKTLASGGRDKTVRLWDPATGAELRTLQGELALAPDVQVIPGLGRFTSKQRGVVAMAFSRDGTMLAVAASADQTFRLWDTASGKELPPFPGASLQVTTLTFLPDGKTLVSGGWDGTVRLWDVAGRKEVRRFQAQGRDPILSLALFPDGKTLAVGGRRTVRLWDLAGGREVRPLGVHHRGVHRLTFSPDGKALASGAYDGTVCLWDPSTGKEVRRLQGPADGIDRLTFSPDGKTLAVGQGTLLLLDAATGEEVLGSRASAWKGAALSPDGKFGCHYPDRDGVLALWDLQKGKEVRRLQGPPRSLSAITFSPDGKYLAVAFYSDPRAIVVWEVATGRKVSECKGGHDTFHALAFSPDGKTLASDGGDGTVRLWEVVTGRERRCFRGHQGWVLSLAFSPDGSRLVSGGDDTLGLVWDMRGSGQPGRTAVGDLAAAELPALWADLASPDAARADRAALRLAANPGQALALLRERVRPVPGVSPQRLARLIADLDSDHFPVRQQATRELEGLADVAKPALLQARQAGLSLEVRRQAERLLEKLVVAQSPERLRQYRAIEVMEGMATPAARRLLEELAGGAPGALLTREAKASLERLARRPGGAP
jgi:RNA polymerase sigma factor (sigma-70 family)